MHARRYRTKGERKLLPARMEKEADKAEEVSPPLRQITFHSSPRLSLHERMTRSDGNGEVRGPSIVDHGSMSIFGRRREMEDAIMQAPGFLPAYGFFAVYDGHGGSMVANLCRERMHVVLAKEVGDLAADVNEEERWRKAMASCFVKVDREAVVAWTAGIIDGTVGATAVVAVVGEHRIVVGNCGNCRAVLCRDSDAIPLSKDHKPDRPDELQRVEAAGGKVISWNGLRIMGLLDTSRSIGNFNFRPFVISEPEVTVLDRTEKDEFLILASAGFWDVVPNDMACHLARQCLTRLTFRGRRISLRNCTSGDIAASLLARLALSRGSMSNISVVVVQLKTMENCDDYMRP